MNFYTLIVYHSFTERKKKQIHSGGAYELIERDYITENQLLSLKFTVVFVLQNLLQFSSSETNFDPKEYRIILMACVFSR